MNMPKPMQNPCAACERSAVCATSENYKCPQFQAIFIQAWDETVAFLRREVERCP